MDATTLYKDAENYIKEELEKLNYPENHPFNDYPKTPESMVLKFIIIIKALTNKDDLVISFLKKCKSVENNSFSFIKYNENASEVIWFYYLYLSLYKTNSIHLLQDIYDENVAIYDNGKKFEFSFLLKHTEDLKEHVVTSEVKAITCDPFKKESELKIVDGQKLIKPLFPELKDSDLLKHESDAIILQASSHYYQTNQNIKRIIKKCSGNSVISKPVFNIGVLFVNFSTSMEEFYSYIFHRSRGIYDKLLKSNVDALVIISMDSHNSLDLENIYSFEYIQTILVKPTPTNIKLCETLKIDNFIALGSEIRDDVFQKAQEEFGYYKILCRDGFLNIIPYDSTEEEIQQYLEYLKGDGIRY